jgi:DNA-binding transcriptional LysR family regulator
MRYFLAVAEELHFRRAAAVLHLSQPSLSQQIHRMEEEIGIKLFKRSSRKVQLTAAGEAFLPRVRAILEGVDAAVHDTRRVDQGFAGLLTVSFVSTALAGVLPAAMKELQEQAPGVDLKMEECEPKEQIASILRGNSDIGFMHGALDDDQLETAVVQRDQLVAALPAKVMGEGPADLRNYRNHTAIMPSPFTAFGFHNHVQRAYRLAGVTPNKIIHTNLIIGGINLVAAGLGIALVPSSFQFIQVRGVTYRPLLTPPPPVELIAVWRRDATSELLHRFLEILTGARKQSSSGIEKRL